MVEQKSSENQIIHKRIVYNFIPKRRPTVASFCAVNNYPYANINFLITKKRQTMNACRFLIYYKL